MAITKPSSRTEGSSARTSGVSGERAKRPRPPTSAGMISTSGISWRRTAGPWFTNMIAVLEFDGAAARVRFDRAAGAGGRLDLESEADLPLC